MAAGFKPLGSGQLGFQTGNNDIRWDTVGACRCRANGRQAAPDEFGVLAAHRHSGPYRFLHELRQRLTVLQKVFHFTPKLWFHTQGR
jgi:hypothetical protein